MDTSRILDRTADHWRHSGGDDITRQAHFRIYNARLGESRRERLFLASVGFFTAVLVGRVESIGFWLISASV
jgi:hypothetical protein